MGSRRCFRDADLSINSCKIRRDNHWQVQYDGAPTCVAWIAGSQAIDLVTATEYNGADGVFVKIQEAVDNGGMYRSCPS